MVVATVTALKLKRYIATVAARVYKRGRESIEPRI